MPHGGYFFDAIIRQEKIDDDHLDPADNLEEFSPLDETALEEIREDVEAAAATGRAVIANFGGTAFGDIALVPAPFLTKPKGLVKGTKMSFPGLKKDGYPQTPAGYEAWSAAQSAKWDAYYAAKAA